MQRAAMDVEIVIERDGAERSVHRVAARGALSVGRQADCAVCVTDDRISRRHALFHLSDESMRVEDTSSNGTLAGQTLLLKQSLEVPYGTPILIGVHTLHVRKVPAPTPDRRHLFGDWSVGVPAGPGNLPHLGKELAQTPPPSEPSAPDPPRLTVSSPSSPSRVSARQSESQLRREIHTRLLTNIDLAMTDAKRLDDPSFRPRVLTALRRIVTAMELPRTVDVDRLIGEMADEALGLGPLERLLADASISEIMVTDADTIYVERAGKIERADARFTDDDRVRAVIERILTPLGRRIDESSPLVDARLSDGSRVNAIIRPLALRGSCITIRKFSREPLTLGKMVELQTLTLRMSLFLSRCVVARKNIVVSGGTGSGKTTLLNALSSAIPKGERIVTIEDASELKLAQPHVVSLETRPANVEGKGEFSIRDLVKNALRMRPDRIVVGECRGAEALDMLQAMNTGHDGSLTTTHANSPAEALSRLETLVLMAGVDLPSRAVREQIASSIQVVVQQARLSDGSRKIVAISEVGGLDGNGEIRLRPLYRFSRTGTGKGGEVLGQFDATGHLPSFLDEFIVRGLVKPGEPYL